MKKWMKGFTIAGIILLFAGSAITVFAGAAGGFRTADNNAIGHRVRKTLGIAGSHWNHWGDHDFRYSGATPVSPKEEMVLAAAYEGVQTLNLEVGYSSVKVVENADLVNTINIYVKDKRYCGVRHRAEDAASKITVEYYSSRRKGIYGEGIVEIPTGYKFNEVDLEARAGNIGIISITADQLEVSTQAGSVTLDSFKAGKLQMDAKAGAVTAAGEVTGDIEIDTEAGAVELLLNGSKTDYQYVLEGAMGNITIGDESHSGMVWEKTIDNKASKKAELSSGVGSIKLKFR